MSVFPGSGKSYLAKTNKQLKILDLDSSEFSWTNNDHGEKIRNCNFVKDYLERIQKELKKRTWDAILVSTHEEIRKELEKQKIKYVTIFPNKVNKEEWINRFIERGDNDVFINYLRNNWDKMIKSLEEDKNSEANDMLGSGEYISTRFVYKWFDDSGGNLSVHVFTN